MPGTWYANSHHRYKFLDLCLARFPQAKNLLLSAYMERDLEEQEEILNEKLDLFFFFSEFFGSCRKTKEVSTSFVSGGGGGFPL